MKNLAAFLETGCRYTLGAEREGVSPERFRSYVLEELTLLESKCDFSFRPHRAAHLRHHAANIQRLLETYDV